MDSGEASKSSLGALFAAAAPARSGGLAIEGVPRRVGRYTLHRYLGSGATASVFAAFDVDLERNVAVKLLHPGISRQRLVREAQALARLRHRNVVSLYELGEQDGQLFIVMELVVGHSLNRVLEDRSPTRREILDLFVQAGRGLQAAHAAGIVHRDFKPANVLVGEDGRVCVVDFGLAKGNYREETVVDRAVSYVSDQTATATGAVLGTPFYMAPEQRSGARVDARADQYAFCLSVWTALYGSHPLAGISLDARSHVTTWESLVRTRGAPRWLHRAIVQGMHPEPDRRWQDMAVLLERVSRSPLRRLLRRAAMGLAMGTAIGALILLGISLLQARTRENAARGDERAALESARAHAERASDQTKVLAARLVRDDPTAAFLLMSEVQQPQAALGWFLSAFRVWHEPVSQTALRGHRDRVGNIMFSPDGSLIATASFDNTARVWRTDGLGSATVLEGHRDNVHFANFSPDGLSVVTSSRDGTAMVWDLASPREPVVLEGHTDIVWWAGFSPDGKKIATASKDYTVRLWDASEALWSSPPPSAEALLTGHENQVWWAEFHPDSDHLVTASKDGTVRLWSLSNPTAQPVIFEGHTDSVLRARFSHDGERVLSAAWDGTARIWPISGGNTVILRSNASRVHDAVFSGDGGRVLTTGNSYGPAQVWDARDGSLVDVSDGALDPPYVGVAGGEWFAVSNRHHCVRLWREKVPGSDAQLCGLGQTVFSLSASPDGLTLAAGSEAGEVRLWNVPASVGRPRIRPAVSGWFTAGGGVTLVNRDHSEMEIIAPGGSETGVWKAPSLEETWQYGDVRTSTGEMLTLTRAGRLSVWRTSDRSLIWTERLNGTRAVLFVSDWYLVTMLGEEWGLLDAETGELLHRTHALSGAIISMVATPDGRKLITAGDEGVIYLWDVEADAKPIQVARTDSPTNTLQLNSPRGGYAVASIEERAWVFSVEDGHAALTVVPDGTPILGVSLSPSGRYLVLGTRAGKAEVWDVSLRRKVDEFRVQIHTGQSFSFTTDGRILAIADQMRGQVVFRATDAQKWLGATDLVTSPRAVNFTGGDNELLVLGEEDGLYRLQVGELLTGDPEQLRTRRATSACLTVQQRRVLLGDSMQEALVRSLTCELGNGRVDRVWDELSGPF